MKRRRFDSDDDDDDNNDDDHSTLGARVMNSLLPISTSMGDGNYGAAALVDGAELSRQEWRERGVAVSSSSSSSSVPHSEDDLLESPPTAAEGTETFKHEKIAPAVPVVRFPNTDAVSEDGDIPAHWRKLMLPDLLEVFFVPLSYIEQRRVMDDTLLSQYAADASGLLPHYAATPDKTSRGWRWDMVTRGRPPTSL